jgi:hypothetical protein
MTMPDRIQITHQDPMTTPRPARTSDDIPPGPLSEDDLRQRWNQQADEHNQWESLDSCEQLAWAQALAIKADRHAAALKAEPQGESPSAADLLPVDPPNIPTTMAMQYRSAWREGVEDGWSEARAILARQGHPHAAAPAPGENPATPPSPEGEGPRLQWTDNMPPSEACRYDHCIAETPFGRFLITWKGWKEYDSPTVDETPWGDWYAAFNSVDDAKAACQQGMNERLARCGTPATPPAPEPGEVVELVEWLNQVAQYLVDNGVTGAPHVQGAAILLEQQEAELAALRVAPGPTYLDAVRLAQGCHDYSGGHSGTEGEAWHGAIDTVVGVLRRAAIGPWDSQTRAVYGVGVEAQAGEVAVPVAVSERRPEAKDCLFNEGATIGKCWCFNPPRLLGGVPWWSFEPLEWAEDATHWLPCNAIPLPWTPPFTLTPDPQC